MARAFDAFLLFLFSVAFITVALWLLSWGTLRIGVECGPSCTISWTYLFGSLEPFPRISFPVERLNASIHLSVEESIFPPHIGRTPTDSPKAKGLLVLRFPAHHPMQGQTLHIHWLGQTIKSSSVDALRETISRAPRTQSRFPTSWSSNHADAKMLIAGTLLLFLGAALGVGAMSAALATSHTRIAGEATKQE